jgi:hypothetical protein
MFDSSKRASVDIHHTKRRQSIHDPPFSVPDSFDLGREVGSDGGKELSLADCGLVDDGEDRVGGFTGCYYGCASCCTCEILLELGGWKLYSGSKFGCHSTGTDT